MSHASALRLETVAAPPAERSTLRPTVVMGAEPLRQDLAAIRTAEQVEALAPEWLALERQAHGAQFFQSAGWARAIFAFEARRRNIAFDPVIVTLRHNGRLVAVLPLERLGGTVRARLRVHVWDRLARPLAKKLVMATPNPSARRCSRLLGGPLSWLSQRFLTTPPSSALRAPSPTRGEGELRGLDKL